MSELVQETSWGYLLKTPEKMTEDDYLFVTEFIIKGILVVAVVTKRTMGKNGLATVQDWTDVDVKLGNALEFVQRLYQEKAIYDFSYKTPPTGFLEEIDRHRKIVVLDGNHRIATALCLDVPIGVRLIAKNTREKVHPFSIIMSPIAREIVRIDS